AGVELEELIDLVLGFGGAGCDETSRGAAGAADVGVRGDELEQIEGDVFRAASQVGAGFHVCLSELLKLMVAVAPSGVQRNPAHPQADDRGTQRLREQRFLNRNFKGVRCDARSETGSNPGD